MEAAAAKKKEDEVTPGGPEERDGLMNVKDFADFKEVVESSTKLLMMFAAEQSSSTKKAIHDHVLKAFQ